MISVINVIVVLFAVVLLFVFARGAWFHTVEQTLEADPALSGQSSGAKTKK